MNEIIYSMPFDAYAARPGINATVLKAARRSMLHARHALTGERNKTAAMAWGSLAHTAILEQSRFLSTLAVWDGGDRRGKDWIEFKAANDGATIVKRDELNELARMVDAVQRNQQVALLIASTKHEVSMFWDAGAAGLAKSRLDGYTSGMIVEIKTAADIDYRRFCNQFYSLGYHVQVGWQVEAAEANGDISPTVWCVAIEACEPFDVRVFRVDDSYVADGRREARELAAAIAECRQRDVWPGQAQTPVEDLCAPVWTMESEVNMEEITND